MAQYNFVVEYDSAEENWSWNINTEHAVFNGKAIYIPETDEWVKPSESKVLTDMDNLLADEIGSAIEHLNGRVELWA